MEELAFLRQREAKLKSATTLWWRRRWWWDEMGERRMEWGRTEWVGKWKKILLFFISRFSFHQRFGKYTPNINETSEWVEARTAPLPHKSLPLLHNPTQPNLTLAPLLAVLIRKTPAYSSSSTVLSAPASLPILGDIPRVYSPFYSSPSLLSVIST